MKKLIIAGLLAFGLVPVAASAADRHDEDYHDRGRRRSYSESRYDGRDHDDHRHDRGHYHRSRHYHGHYGRWHGGHDVHYDTYRHAVRHKDHYHVHTHTRRHEHQDHH